MQSRRMSLIEALVNIGIGYFISLAGQVVIFGAIGIKVSLGQDIMIGLFFTALSLARSYILRRIFNKWLVRQDSNL